MVPVVKVLINDGNQVPDIPSLEKAGNDGEDAAKHKGPMGAKVGICEVLTVTVIVAVEVQGCKAALGVKVYIVVAKLLIAGDQVPEMPSLELFGRLKLPPEQIGCTCVKVGV